MGIRQKQTKATVRTALNRAAQGIWDVSIALYNFKGLDGDDDYNEEVEEAQEVAQEAVKALEDLRDKYFA